MQLTKIFPPHLPVWILQRLAILFIAPVTLALIFLSILAWQGGQRAPLWWSLLIIVALVALAGAMWVFVPRLVRQLDKAIDFGMEWLDQRVRSVKRFIRRTMENLTDLIEEAEALTRTLREIGSAVAQLYHAAIEKLHRRG
ncbi:hypothetical protein IVB08_01920 [Bradyrhizobium sp. 173]|uniref:hypothetical protein n=1 Tax=Bradyrhizobium sp. 173 TaxID=2782644 RepID=UPI001FF97958|nr:hypothetical protein [Bradyrhizobium sp. 173]MCK1562769.1 hypothetical protein [Bradyrhizobium sp. 173]